MVLGARTHDMDSYMPLLDRSVSSTHSDVGTYTGLCPRCCHSSQSAGQYYDPVMALDCVQVGVTLAPGHMQCLLDRLLVVEIVVTQ